MITEKKAKTILQKSRLPESQYCLNPYVGCTHRCIYCYARFMRRFTGHSEQWGRFVDVKVNAPEILERQLERSKVKGTVLIGSVCDAYQPIETKYGLTRSCIKLLVKNKVNFSVLTKSSLVLRDLDILKQAGSSTSVGISLSIHNDGIRQRFEPGASSVKDRLDTLKRLHECGIRTYVFIGPILPLISNPEAIVASTGPFVNEVWAEALNMRCGNREDLVKAYEVSRISNEWQNLARSDEYWKKIVHILNHACDKAGKNLIGFYRH